VKRALRLVTVGLLAASILVVIPGEVSAIVPGATGRIAFISNADGGNWDIYVRDFASSSPTRLTFNIAADVLPAWSPDGTQIVFTRVSSGASDIYVMNADGSNPTNLTNHATAYVASADWSPDGLWILFESNLGGVVRLWKMHPDGSDPQMIFDGAVQSPSATWSPDGSRIAFARYSATSGVDIWVVNADGSGATGLTDRSGDEDAPAWSPDGTRLAYQSDAGSSTDVWVMDADGSDQVNVTHNPATVWSGRPAWFPDGTQIAYTSDADGDDDVWMMNPDGSGKAHLTDSPDIEDQIAFESVDRDPVVVDDIVHVARGGSVQVAVLGNDYDPDGEQLEVVDVTRMPAYGSAVINQNGTITYAHNNGTPPSGGGVYADSFDYEVMDPRMGSAIGTVTVWVHPAFADVPISNVFSADIVWLAEQGITRGCDPPDNMLFCPEDLVTRGQMAAFLVRALGLTDDGGGNLFVDDGTSVFEPDIDKLGASGVTRGCNPPLNDRFCPAEVVTRGQMAAFLARAYNLSAGSQSDLFVDDNGSVFESDIDKLGATGVSKGCNPPDNDRFCPNDPVSRQQMAAFLHRAAMVP
jgi:Tol biopolymer transport system component